MKHGLWPATYRPLGELAFTGQISSDPEWSSKDEWINSPREGVMVSGPENDAVPEWGGEGSSRADDKMFQDFQGGWI